VGAARAAVSVRSTRGSRCTAVNSVPDPLVNETPMVPDLERLEELIADETSISAA